MVRAEELRIGNWLQHSGSKTPYMVTLERFWKDYVTADAFYYLEPIELTEDILIKCGFKKSQFLNITFDLNGFIITNNGNGFILSTGIFNVKVKYLHQLQNLIYSLTGEELTIKL